MICQLVAVVFMLSGFTVCRVAVGDPLNGASRRLLRSIAATMKRSKQLSIIRYNAPSEHSLLEIKQSLAQYELVLLRMDSVDKKHQAKLIGSELASLTNSSLVQTLGHTVLLYKPSDSPDSNISTLMQAEFRSIRSGPSI